MGVNTIARIDVGQDMLNLSTNNTKNSCQMSRRLTKNWAVWLVPTRIWSGSLQNVFRREGLTRPGLLEFPRAATHHSEETCRQLPCCLQTAGYSEETDNRSLFLNFMITNLNLCEETPNIKNVINVGKWSQEHGWDSCPVFLVSAWL